MCMHIIIVLYYIIVYSSQRGLSGASAAAE